MSKRNENGHIQSNREHIARNINNTHHINNYNLNKPINGRVLLSSVSAPTVYGAETTPIADTDNRGGWLFKKVATGTDKFNYYFYGQGNNALTLGDLKGMNAIISVDKYDNVSSAPFFVVYTKLTGSGDAGSWYHSKKAYALDTSVDLQVGELCEVYSGSKPSYKGYRQIELKSEIDTGDLAITEEIYTMSIHSDSDALINTQILVKSVGYDAKDISRTIELTT
tara:strand:+ start:494 stop:1165 length:672 start_codon:yes stop_codon:yes gene_type:complete